jgi:hypothetical protein
VVPHRQLGGCGQHRRVDQYLFVSLAGIASAE